MAGAIKHKSSVLEQYIIEFMSEKIKVGIVGLGLIGGSIEKCLKTKPEKYELFVVSNSQDQGFLSNGERRTLADLANVDILFLCSAQSQIPKQLREIAALMSKAGIEGATKPFANTIITDVGSTKEAISNLATELGLVNFVGGHPMAGTEHQGYEASFAELFQGCNWVLSYSDETTEILEQVIKVDLGATNLLVLDPQTHDQCAAAISHLPLLLSLGLGEIVRDMPLAKQMIGPGFTGMVRLAKGNEALGLEIISANRRNIKELWRLYKQHVDSILEISGDNLAEEMAAIKQALTA